MCRSVEMPLTVAAIVVVAIVVGDERHGVIPRDKFRVLRDEV